MDEEGRTTPFVEHKSPLIKPLVRIGGTLQPVSWDFALDIAAEVSKHVIANHGANAYSVKTYSYQYVENTYAITKFARRGINTAAFTFHDTPWQWRTTWGKFQTKGFEDYKKWVTSQDEYIPENAAKLAGVPGDHATGGGASGSFAGEDALESDFRRYRSDPTEKTRPAEDPV